MPRSWEERRTERRMCGGVVGDIMWVRGCGEYAWARDKERDSLVTRGEEMCRVFGIPGVQKCGVQIAVWRENIRWDDDGRKIVRD
jgi:hypothetical protein